MSEKLITFTSYELKAILDGRKTQFRQVVMPQPESICDGYMLPLRQSCPYGYLGDILRIAGVSDDIILEITDVRIHQVADISEKDALEEGIWCFDDDPYDPMYCLYPPSNIRQTIYSVARDAYKCFWNMTNPDHLWKSNPWVWAINFRPNTKYTILC